MKKILLIIVLVVGSLSGMAQGPKKPPTPEQEREFREFKMKYLAQEMELKEDQSERFFELYEKMWNEKKQVRKRIPELEKKIREGKDVTDEDYDRFQDAINESRSKEIEIDKRYDAEFSKFLTKKQLYKFKDAECRFRDKMREMRGPGKCKPHHPKKK